MTHRIAALQYRPPKGDVPAARGGLCALVEQAAASGAALIVGPEMSTTGYVWPTPDAIASHAEEAEGPTFRALQKIARAHRAWIVTGFAERGPDGKMYNAAWVIDGSGELRAVYRKILLYELDGAWASAGHQRVVVASPFGRIVPGICMDLNDDRFVHFVRRERPDVVAFCTNWIDEGVDILPFWRWRLHGWQGWFVAADTWGDDEGVPFYGRSTILGPDGQVAGAAGPSGDRIVWADAELPLPAAEVLART